MMEKITIIHGIPNYFFFQLIPKMIWIHTLVYWFIGINISYAGHNLRDITKKPYAIL